MHGIDFKELYQSDIHRYGSSCLLYLKIWHYLFRKAQSTKISYLKRLYNYLFEIHSKRRGIEMGMLII